jgi:hypothetical protein
MRPAAASAATAELYRRYLAGWASDYLNFRANGAWAIGRVTPAHEQDELPAAGHH